MVGLGETPGVVVNASVVLLAPANACVSTPKTDSCSLSTAMKSGKEEDPEKRARAVEEMEGKSRDSDDESEYEDEFFFRMGAASCNHRNPPRRCIYKHIEYKLTRTVFLVKRKEDKPKNKQKNKKTPAYSFIMQ